MHNSLPATPAELGVWLDRHLLDLTFDSESESAAFTEDDDPASWLGTYGPHVLENGFANLPHAVLVSLAERVGQHPGNLNRLQDWILLRSGAFWQRKLGPGDGDQSFDLAEIKQHVQGVLVQRITGKPAKSSRPSVQESQTQAANRAPVLSHRRRILVGAAIAGLLVVSSSLVLAGYGYHRSIVASLRDDAAAAHMEAERVPGLARRAADAESRAEEQQAAWQKKHNALQANLDRLTDRFDHQSGELQMKQKEAQALAERLKTADLEHQRVKDALSKADKSLAAERMTIAKLQADLAKLSLKNADIILEKSGYLDPKQNDTATVSFRVRFEKATKALIVVAGEGVQKEGEEVKDVELRIRPAGRKDMVLEQDIAGYSHCRFVRLNAIPGQEVDIELSSANSKNKMPNRFAVIVLGR